jgi:translation initiation factor IF-3
LGRFHRGNAYPTAPEHRINGRIRIPEIRVIAADGEPLGIMHPDEARKLAREQELDLVEVSPNVRPPVCRLMDYGKFKYEKKKQRAATKSASSCMKIVQMRPKTDDHDLNTKLERARGFLKRGDKVKIVMRLRGRENAYPERWTTMMREYYEESLAGVARMASRPSMQGRAISMVVEPN